jgi:ESCRT-II complex subunit VPS36
MAGSEKPPNSAEAGQAQAEHELTWPLPRWLHPRAGAPVPRRNPSREPSEHWPIRWVRFLLPLILGGGVLTFHRSCSNQKAPNHQNGSIHLTSHRLIYIDGPHPRRHSLAFALSDVRKSEYYAGFLTSSPKVTVFLSSPIQPSKPADARPAAGEAPIAAPSDSDTSFIRWECEICGNRNVDTDLAPKLTCQLCGVPRSSKSLAVTIAGPSKTFVSTPPLSQSLPASTFPRLLSVPPNPPSETNDDDNGSACPACTFINHPSLRICEICTTPLPTRTRIPNKSAPSSRPPSPTLEDPIPIGGDAVIKVSFRGGGDRAFHAVLKRVLISKAWVVDVPTIKAAPVGGSKSGIRTFSCAPLLHCLHH